MNLLDVRTIIFSHVVTDALCTAVLISLWIQNRKRFAGTTYWLLGFAFQTAATLLIALRSSLPDWASIVAANTMVIAGMILGYIGLKLFVGEKSSQIHNYILLAIFAAIHSYFTFVQPDLAARTLNLSVGLLIVCFQCAWLLLHQAERGTRQMTRWVGLIFLGYCLVSIIRIVAVLTSPFPSNDFFQSGLYNALLLVSYQLLLILLAFGLVLMVNQRLFMEIQTQEEKFSKAFRSSPYAITLTQLPDGQIIEVNAGFVTLSGYSYAEAVGKTTLDLHLWARETDRVAFIEELSQCQRVLGREFQFRTKSGELLTGLLSAEIIIINDQPWILSSIDNITERKQAEEILQQQNEYLAALQDISLDLVSRLELANLLENIVIRAGQLLGTMAGFLDLLEPESGQLKPYIGVGVLAESLKFPAEPGEGLAGTVWQTGQALVIDNYDAWPGRIKGFGHNLIRSIIGVPLLSGSQVMGVLGLAYDYDTNKTFAPEAVELLSQFARLAVIAIENARLFAALGRELIERKRAEEALQEKDLIFQAFMEYSPIYVFFKDHDIRALQLSRNYEQMLGLPLENILGKTMDELFPSDLAKSMIEDDKKILYEGKVVRVDEELNGHSYTTIKFPIHLAGKPPLLAGFTIDITERRQIEKALRESEERFRTLVESSVDGTLVHRNTKPLFVNPAYARILGYESPHEILSMDSVIPLIAPHEQERLLAYHASRIKGEPAPTQYEYDAIRKDGSIVTLQQLVTTISWDGEPAVLATIIDVTERRRAEEVMRLRLRLLEFAADHSLEELMQRALDEIGTLTRSPIGFYHFVEADQKTLSLQAWSTHTQQEFCKAEGKGLHYNIDEAGVWVECVHQRQPVIHNDYAALPASRRKGMPPGHAEVRRELVVPTQRSGRIVSVLGVGNKPINYDERDVELVAYVADVIWTIVERKQAEEQLQEYQSRLEAQNLELRKYAGQLAAQNAELDAFAHTVAHDLKNPVGIITGFAEVLVTDYETMTPKILADALRSILRTSQKLDRIIEELMLLAGIRKQAVSPEPLDMGRIVKESVERLQVLVRERQAQISLPDQVTWPVVLGYAPWVEEVWANYISNAIKYGGQPPQIELGFSILTDETNPANLESEQVSQAPAPEIKFWVRDNGRGLSAKTQVDLFAPFTRLEQIRAVGHGLGLSIVRRIVEKLGGQAGVESKLGQGSTFFFTLPAAPDKSIPEQIS